MNWPIVKLNHCFKIIGSGTTPKSTSTELYDGEIPWVTTSELRENVITTTKKHVSEKAFESHSALRLFPKGSLAIAMYGATIGRLGIFGIDATVNQACCVFAQPIDTDIKYIYYYLQAVKEELLLSARGGGQPNLSQDDLRQLRFKRPPLPTQRAIARYLDERTTRIDALIAAKERLLDLLAERRAALITRAVTRGLDENVELKDSEVEWLGEIPVGWEVKRLGHLTDYVGSGKTPKGGAAVYVNEGIPMLRSQNVYNDGLRLDDVIYITNEMHQDQFNTSVQSGDVLLNITGASIGRAYYITDELGLANVNQHVCIIRPSKDLSQRFLHYFIISSIVFDWIYGSQSGASREGLNFQQIRQLRIALPPKFEDQQEIVEALDGQVNKQWSATILSSPSRVISHFS